jgi:hypothetical protein
MTLEYVSPAQNVIHSFLYVLWIELISKLNLPNLTAQSHMILNFKCLLYTFFYKSAKVIEVFLLFGAGKSPTTLLVKVL